MSTPYTRVGSRRAARAGLPGRAQGGAAVELALVLWVMVALVLGVMDLARWLAAAASLAEAARLGARTAVVCDLQDPQVSARALSRLVGPRAWAQPPTVTVTAEPLGCTHATCQRVRVSLQGASLSSLLPWWGGSLPLPATETELPRESLSSQLNGRNNPQCQ